MSEKPKVELLYIFQCCCITSKGHEVSPVAKQHTFCLVTTHFKKFIDLHGQNVSRKTTKKSEAIQ